MTEGQIRRRSTPAVIEEKSGLPQVQTCLSLLLVTDVHGFFYRPMSIDKVLLGRALGSINIWHDAEHILSISATNNDIA